MARALAIFVFLPKVNACLPLAVRMFSNDVGFFFSSSNGAETREGDSYWFQKDHMHFFVFMLLFSLK